MAPAIRRIGIALQQPSLLEAVDDAHHLAPVDCHRVTHLLLRAPAEVVDASQHLMRSQVEPFATEITFYLGDQQLLEQAQGVSGSIA
jgi:hypothetical protein